MPITFPPAVRNAWGADVTDEVARVLDETFERRAVSRGEFHEVTGRLDVIEERLDGIDGRLDRMDERFNQMDQRFDAMNARLSAR